MKLQNNRLIGFEPFFLCWRKNTFLVDMFSRLGLGEYFDS